jgi:hypothetical protein
MWSASGSVIDSFTAFDETDAHLGYGVKLLDDPAWLEDPLPERILDMKQVCLQDPEQLRERSRTLAGHLSNYNLKDIDGADISWRDRLSAGKVMDDKYSTFTCYSRRPLEAVVADVCEFQDRHRGPLTRDEAAEWLSKINVETYTV